MTRFNIQHSPAFAREVCFLLGRGGVLLWSEPSPSPVAIPDSRERWETIWMLREQLFEVAHTHPLGSAHFSTEDRTTMEAIDSALGRRLAYTVVSPRQIRRRSHAADIEGLVDPEPWWAPLIRHASGMTAPRPIRCHPPTRRPQTHHGHPWRKERTWQP